jgi:hypothetical protein
VHANAGTYGFDPQNVFAMGHSAGGTLVAMLGSVEDPARYLAGCPHVLPEGPWVRGTIPFTGIFDYASAVERAVRLNEYASDLLGGTLDEVPETWAEASPATWVDGSELPFLIIHGGSDSNISPGNSEAFAGVLEAAGVEVELLVVPGASHEEITRSEASVQAVEAFVSRLVAEGPPPAGPAFDPSVFMLWSPAFGPEGTIPAKHTCKGEDVSPPLMWGEPPTGTKSLVIVVDDISVGDLTHWLLFNIPPDTRSLPEGVAKVGHLSDGSQQGTNNLFEVGYFGPCPMPGPNRYRFRLFALDTMLDLEDGVMRIPMKQAMRGHILAETELVGVFP